MTASILKKISGVLSAGAVLFYAASAALPAMAAETDKNWKKAQISDYDTSLSLVEYQEVDETEAEKSRLRLQPGNWQLPERLVLVLPMLRFLWQRICSRENLALPLTDMDMAADSAKMVQTSMQPMADMIIRQSYSIIIPAQH